MTPPPERDNAADAIANYTRSLHNYTLALWTESRRVAEERAHPDPRTGANWTITSAQTVAAGEPPAQASTSAASEEGNAKNFKGPSTPNKQS